MRPVQGLGLAWRPETAWLVDRRPDLGFTEVVAENLEPAQLPAALRLLCSRSVPIIPHGVSLGLGGAAPPEPARLDHLCRLAEALRAPFVSEHVAFVRAEGLEAGHLLPLPRTLEALEVLVANVELAQRALPVPLVLENVASVFEWPDAELSEAEFLKTLFDATGAEWLLDVSNLYANVENHGWDLERFLIEAPFDRVAYAHIAGGERTSGIYHDTHAHPLDSGVFQLAQRLFRQTGALPLLLERDHAFGEREGLEAELDQLARLVCDLPSREALRAS